MGFEVQDTEIRLMFSDPSYEGLEVVCRVVPLGELRAAAALKDIDPKDVSGADLNAIDEIVDSFGDALVSWNLTRKGKKVPATKRGVKTLSTVFVLELIEAWLTGIGKVMAERAEEDAQDEQTKKEAAEIEAGLGVSPL